jgi:dihydrofolate reductase
MFNHFDTEVAGYLGSQIASQDAVLLGRATYELWASYWPASTVEPFASFINNTPKYVASRTLNETGWKNSSVIEGRVEDKIHQLKGEPGKNIGVHGSSRLVCSLLRQGLIDELRLVIPPVIVGTGERLFDGSQRVHRLTLVESQATSTGVLLVAYGRQTD